MAFDKEHYDAERIALLPIFHVLCKTISVRAVQKNLETSSLSLVFHALRLDFLTQIVGKVSSVIRNHQFHNLKVTKQSLLDLFQKHIKAFASFRGYSNGILSAFK